MHISFDVSRAWNEVLAINPISHLLKPPSGSSSSSLGTVHSAVIVSLIQFLSMILLWISLIEKLAKTLIFAIITE